MPSISDTVLRIRSVPLARIAAQLREPGGWGQWGRVRSNIAGTAQESTGRDPGRSALPTREDAEDATMEIFMKLKGKLVQYDTARSFSAWLYKVAANHCWDILRRRKIRQDKETDDLDNVPLEHPDPSQLDQLIEQRSSEEVRKALEKLGGRARMALVMRYYSDMSYDEIADALGVRRAFVGVVLLRARHELRQALEGNAALAAGGTS